MALRVTCTTPRSLPSSTNKSKKKALKEVNGICKLLKKLKVASNAKILDFSCGIGNHSFPLSKMGYSVIGYDPSSFYLRTAMNNFRGLEGNKKRSLRFIEGDPYCSSDVLLKNNESNFDVIIIMDNSFGYFDKSRDIYMLKILSRVAKPDCLLIVETENRDWRLLNFEPVTCFESDKLLIYGKWNFDFETSVSTGSLKFFQRTGKGDVNWNLALRLEMIMRLYSLHELIEVIGKAGWNYRLSFDDIISLIPFSNKTMSIFSISSMSR